MVALEAAAHFDAPEQLIEPERELACLSSSSWMAAALYARPVNSGVRFLLNAEAQSSALTFTSPEQQSSS